MSSRTAILVVLALIALGTFGFVMRGRENVEPEPAAVHAARVTFATHPRRPESKPTRPPGEPPEKPNADSETAAEPPPPDSMTTHPLHLENMTFAASPVHAPDAVSTATLAMAAPATTATQPLDEITTPTQTGDAATSAPAGRGKRSALSAPNLQGVVTTPDGQRIEGAMVYLCKNPHSQIMVSSGLYDDSHVEGVKAITDRDGTFGFVINQDSYGLIVRHASGIAMRTELDFKSGETIVVPPWGRLEGTVAEGKTPKPKTWVWVYFDARMEFDKRHPEMRDSGGVPPGMNLVKPSVSYYARTDDQGRFVIDRIQAATAIEVSEAPTGQPLPKRPAYLWVPVKPGETTQVRIGGFGRPVKGQIVLNAAPELDFFCESLSATILGDRFQRGVELTPDGRFNVPEIPAGTSRVSAHLTGKFHGLRLFSRIYEQSFEIPPIEGELSEDPLDLGKVEFKIKER